MTKLWAARLGSKAARCFQSRFSSPIFSAISSSPQFDTASSLRMQK